MVWFSCHYEYLLNVELIEIEKCWVSRESIDGIRQNSLNFSELDIKLRFNQIYTIYDELFLYITLSRLCKTEMKIEKGMVTVPSLINCTVAIKIHHHYINWWNSDSYDENVTKPSWNKNQGYNSFKRLESTPDSNSDR